MGIFNFAKNKTVEVVFNADLNDIKKQSFDIQYLIGIKVKQGFDELQQQFSKEITQQQADFYRYKFKNDRKNAIAIGGESFSNINYSVACILEMVVVCMDDEKVFKRITHSIFDWLEDLKLLNRDAKVVISCPRCSQKCRVPVNKEIEVKCPNCLHKWIGIY